MSKGVVTSIRFSPDTKERLVAVATAQGVSESVLIKGLVEAALRASAPLNSLSQTAEEQLPTSGKISVRLRPDDLSQLRDRARARSMPTGTFVSFLLRGYLRSLAPLPTAEFELLRKSLVEVGAIGRNINQIARRLNMGQPTTGPATGDLQMLIRALTALQEHFRKLLDANLRSWEVGYEEKNH